MSPRGRPPTDDVSTAVFDAGQLRAPAVAGPADRELSRGSSEIVESFEQAVTDVNPRHGVGFERIAGAGAFDQPTPTEIDASQPLPPAVPAAARAERSEPIQVISMKDQVAQPPRIEPHRVPLHVQLRSMAQASGHHDAQPGLGHLAPPRDPLHVTPSARRSMLLWYVAIALAVALAVAIGLLARR